MSQHFLYSMSEFMPLVRELLPPEETFSLTEIGSELGTMTRELLGLVDQGRLGRYVIIEPYPSEPLLEMARGGRFQLVEALSVEALRDLPLTDVYLIDGDHNYHTVHHETTLILERATREGKAPLLLYHDVGWPWAERDMYYAPEMVPPEARHPHSFHLGPTPGHGALSGTGWRSIGVLAGASLPGGPKNGVRTALVDAAAAYPSWEFLQVDSIFGLGILLRQDHPDYPRLRRVLGPFVDNFLIRRLEQNRLDLMMEIQALEDLRDARTAQAAEACPPTSLPTSATYLDRSAYLEEAGDGNVETGPEAWLLSPVERVSEIWAALAREGQWAYPLGLDRFAPLRRHPEVASEEAYTALASYVRDPAACVELEARTLEPFRVPGTGYGSRSFLGREQALIAVPQLSPLRREAARAALALAGELPGDRRTLNPILPDAAFALGPTLFRFVDWCLEEALGLGLARLAVRPDELDVLQPLLAQGLAARGHSLDLQAAVWTEEALLTARLLCLDEAGLGALMQRMEYPSPAAVERMLGLPPGAIPEPWKGRLAGPDPRGRRLALLELVSTSPLRATLEARSRAAKDTLLSNLQTGALVGLGWAGPEVDAVNRILREAGRADRIHGLFLDPPEAVPRPGLWQRFPPESTLLAMAWRTPEDQGAPSHPARLREGLLHLHRQWIRS